MILWDEVRPLMIHETVPLAEEKPFHVDYNAQSEKSGIPAWKEPSL